MSFKGEFVQYRRSLVRPGNKVMRDFCTDWCFVLTNTSLLGSKRVTVYMSDYYGGQQKQCTIDTRARESYRLNADTVGWSWHQGDRAVAVDSDGSEVGSWMLYVREYANGECPECHGSHKCSACGGQGVFLGGQFGVEIITCQKCCGTGMCTTCEVPYRTDALGNAIHIPNPALAGRHRSPRKLDAEIGRVRQQLADAQQRLWNLQLRGRQHTTEFMSLSRQVDMLRQRLESLENERNMM